MEPGKQDNKSKQEGAYGKRPWWQWALIYVVIGGLVYWLIYYVVTADGNGGGLY